MVLVLTLRAVSGYSLSREPVYATAREYDESLDGDVQAFVSAVTPAGFEPALPA